MGKILSIARNSQYPRRRYLQTEENNKIILDFEYDPVMKKITVNLPKYNTMHDLHVGIKGEFRACC